MTRKHENARRRISRGRRRVPASSQRRREAGFVEVAETMLSMHMEYTCFDDYWAPYLGKDGPGAEYVGTLDATARNRILVNVPM